MNRERSTCVLWRNVLVSLLVAIVLLLAVGLGGGQHGRSVEAQDLNAFLQSLTEEERAWLRDHPVIQVAQAPDWPPVEFADERGEPSGMSEDYLKLIEQRLGLKFERVHGLSWQEEYARLKRWEIDMTTCVTETPERTKFWAFTKPYMKIPNVIFADVNVTYIADIRELEGKKVAVVDGYAISEWIPRDFPAIQLIKVKNVQEGLEKLQRGEVSAYVGEMLVSSYYLTTLKMLTLKIAGNTPYVNAQSMAVRKDWAILAVILDKALDSISETERNDIYRRWLPVRYEHGFDYTLFWWALAAFAVILLVSAAWIWRLLREIEARKKAEEAIRTLNAELEQRVRKRTAELEDAVKELEAFSYSVSHDLRSPLRAIDGFSRLLLTTTAGHLDGEQQHLLQVIRSSTQQMGQLIEDLLMFSRLGRQELRKSKVDMEKLAHSVFEELRTANPDRPLELVMDSIPPALGDLSMLRQVWFNLLSNSVKFTRGRDPARIEIGSQTEGGMNRYSVKDNGVGFDMHYADKLFGVFQRLHSTREFEGTGVGLAIVQRVIHRLGGEVQADGIVGVGATFAFTLPKGE